MDDWAYAEDTRGMGFYPQGLRTPAPQTHLTRLRHGATALGISLEAYIAHREAGESWCSYHKAWHPLAEFGTARVRGTVRIAGVCRPGAASAEREYRRRKRERSGGTDG
jgi:hypothetical protein